MQAGRDREREREGERETETERERERESTHTHAHTKAKYSCFRLAIYFSVSDLQTLKSCYTIMLIAKATLTEK